MTTSISFNSLIFTLQLSLFASVLDDELSCNCVENLGWPLRISWLLFPQKFKWRGKLGKFVDLGVNMWSALDTITFPTIHALACITCMARHEIVHLAFTFGFIIVLRLLEPQTLAFRSMKILLATRALWEDGGLFARDDSKHETRKGFGIF